MVCYYERLKSPLHGNAARRIQLLSFPTHPSHSFTSTVLLFYMPETSPLILFTSFNITNISWTIRMEFINTMVRRRLGVQIPAPTDSRKNR